MSQPGSRHTYTADLLHARQFQSRRAAEAAKRGNEMVIDFAAMLGGLLTATSRLYLTALFDDGDAIQTSINASHREAAEHYLCNTFTSQDEKPRRCFLVLFDGGDFVRYCPVSNTYSAKVDDDLLYGTFDYVTAKFD